MNFTTKKICLLSLFATIAIALFVVELQIPPLTPIYGIKLGLANIVTLFVLMLGNKWHLTDALIILVIRVTLSAFITGQPMAILWSGVGGLLALFAMAVTKRFTRHIPIISILGATFHNIGQLLVAVVIYGTPSVFYYFPMLMISGIIGGIINGFFVYYIFKFHKNLIVTLNK